MPVCLNGIHDQINSNKGLLKMVNGETGKENEMRILKRRRERKKERAEELLTFEGEDKVAMADFNERVRKRELYI